MTEAPATFVKQSIRVRKRMLHETSVTKSFPFFFLHMKIAKTKMQNYLFFQLLSAALRSPPHAC